MAGVIYARYSSANQREESLRMNHIRYTETYF